MLWDTSGQERFKSLSQRLIKISNIIILVYDITNRKSFEQLNSWKNAIYDQVDIKNIVVGVIGNKNDLYLQEQVSREEGEMFAESNLFYFTLLSAKDSVNPLKNFIELLIKRYLEIKPENKNIYLEDKEEERRRNRNKQCCQNEIYFPFMERFKGRVFPWYLPIWELRKKNKKNSLI